MFKKTNLQSIYEKRGVILILQLEKKEMASLVLHMAIMRKNVRKGFKKNYGNEAKEVLSSYDEVKKTMIQVLEKMGEQEGKKELHFNIKEIDMLQSFLGFYIEKVEEEIKLNKMSEEDRDQIECLKSIDEKVDILKAA